MKPLLLKMQAFGPYVDEAIVDFEKLGDGLYLISGNTGSGKTIIFDAITFALFGKASGEARRNLKTEQLYSDLCRVDGVRPEMKVEFTFAEGNSVYMVIRTGKWGATGKSKTFEYYSEIFKDGKSIEHSKNVPASNEVTDKIQNEILHMNADQFSRIVMLAQGEFQKFLTSSREQRKDTLEKLYDVSEHNDLQGRLKAIAKKLSDEAKSMEKEADTHIHSLKFPGEYDEESIKNLNLSIYNENLPSILRSLVQETVERIDEVDKNISDMNQKKSSLVAEEAAGKEINGQINSLNEKKEQYTKIDDANKNRGDLQRKLDRAKSAEKLLPYAVEKDKAAKALTQKEKAIASLKEKQRGYLDIKQGLKTARDTAEATLEPEISGLKKELNVVENILPNYDHLEGAERNKGEKEKALEKAGNDLKLAEKKENKAKADIQILKETLDSLKDAGDPAVEKAERSLKDLEQRKTDLSQIETGIKKVETLYKEKEKAYTVYEAEEKRKEDADKEYTQKLSAFRRGHAGILAQEMIKELDNSDEAEVTCPVCGARHTKADIGSFAAMEEGCPTDKEVDDASEALKSAIDGLQEATKSFTVAEGNWSSAQKELLTQSEKLIGIPDWPTLINGSDLSQAVQENQVSIEKAKADLAKAKKDRDTKKDTAEKLNDLEAELAELSKTKDEVLAKKTDAEKAKAGAENEVNTWKKALQGYPENMSEAKKGIEKLRKEIQTKQDALDKAKKDFEDIERNLDNVNTRISVAENDRSAEDRDEAAKQNYAEQLSKLFTDEEEYHQALSPEGKLLNGNDLAAWIKETQANLDNTTKALGDLNAQIQQLMDSIGDRTCVDTESIKGQIQMLESEINEETGKRDDLIVQRDTNSDIQNNLARVRSQLKKNEKAQKIVKPLSDAANGEAGYIGFSLYILTELFERVVEKANDQLSNTNVDSEEEFQLVATDEKEGNSRKRGLGLKVLRETVENETSTLSGGQIFSASLALALALAKIIQDDGESNVQMESMFIDEGFGTLDDLKLEKTIKVLLGLAEGGRQIGIISHVKDLDEYGVGKTLPIYGGKKGSRIGEPIITG